MDWSFKNKKNSRNELARPVMGITCLVNIDINVIEKIRGPGATYGGVLRTQYFGAENQHALTCTMVGKRTTTSA